MPSLLIIVGLVVQFLGLPTLVSAGIVEVRKVQDGSIATHTELHYIIIKTAICEADENRNLTGIYVDGLTNENVNELVGHSEVLAPRKGINDGAFYVQPYKFPETGENGFRYNPLLATHSNVELCPSTVTIKGADGLQVVAKVQSHTISRWG